MRMKELFPLLKEFVNRNSKTVDIQWDQRMSPKLLINPHSENYEERGKVAHYFLLVSSVVESKVVGISENARCLLVHLHKAFKDDLFEVSKARMFKDKIRKCGFCDRLGSLRGAIPNILASVNKFVKYKAKGDLIKYAQEFGKPKDMVEEIAENVERMGGPFEDKSWVYMRWMVRPYPDLRIFNNFSPRDLFIPLTGSIANVAKSLGLIDTTELSLWEDKQRAVKARESVTNFAKEFFPRDPAKVDYPFFLLGRWLRGKDLGRETLEEALRFFVYLHEVTGHPHAFYQRMSRYKSGWEKKVADTLSKMNIPFGFERIPFPLPYNIRYTPDFILSESIQGRRIVLEPHHEMMERDAYKFSLFRQTYGNNYFLILLMRNDDISYYRARNLLPNEAYDDVWPIEYVHILLEQIRTGRYGQQR